MVSAFLKPLLAILLTVAITGLIVWLYFETKLSKILFTTEFSLEDVNAYNNQSTTANSSKFAVALFGLDARHEGESSRSDTIMILLIDHSMQKIKLASIMRDLYVDVPGYGKRKINSAYELGGPKLALSTLNTNFELALTKYVTVDFRGFEKIIDAVGGVEIDVKDYEVEHININMREVRNLIGGDVPEVKYPGLQRLNGRQALAYARIRYVGNGDYERVQRQQRVFEKVFEKVKNASLGTKLRIIDMVLPYIETNLTRNEIVSLATKNYSKYTLEHTRLPVSGSYREGYATIDGIKQWIFITDIEKNKQALHEFLER
ncbi:cell envelope-related function transcriptional attenuator common domain protein [Fervidobacterium pennivorans DSM 9078]|uniref:Cell envelope-related function transcriptional attenuator common domain protein n=1 Tax=Fervidobacterium pennivorans (strain DSM 9078 / Ven5) TaxID=771875 RepID=H9U9V4_FERPD|nr:LCP family protein [Fervidobacterium pennivorans]AFG34297.1 cell envelope-related function transcriptional attenuator common domain protein [Fervidobacterium pennivorans DSM 9078]